MAIFRVGPDCIDARVSRETGMYHASPAIIVKQDIMPP